jgi:carbon-monoxide dehydrogenase medium subunit
MVAAAFEHVTASSYDEAAAQLAAYGDEARILAGGQSLLPMLNLRLTKPAVLIDINGADQRLPSQADGTLRLPALTRHRVLSDSDLVRRHCPLLASAIRHVGNVRVRNRGTVGGSMAHADPTSEVGCCALATGAVVVARGPDGDRRLPASELFAGYWSTTLAETEVITDLEIPAARPRQGWSFHEMARRTSDFAIVAAAAVIDVQEEAGPVSAARIALAGVAGQPVLAAADLVAGLIGGTGARAGEVATLIAGSLEPPSDVHASGAYRRRLVQVLVTRAILEAYRRASGPQS